MQTELTRVYDDPRWQRERLEVFNRDGWKCRECGAVDRPLHVHHRRYLRGHQPWEYPAYLLETVCSECHAALHKGDPLMSECVADTFYKLGAGGPELADLTCVLMDVAEKTGATLTRREWTWYIAYLQRGLTHVIALRGPAQA